MKFNKPLWDKYFNENGRAKKLAKKVFEHKLYKPLLEYNCKDKSEIIEEMESNVFNPLVHEIDAKIFLLTGLKIEKFISE